MKRLLTLLFAALFLACSGGSDEVTVTPPVEVPEVAEDGPVTGLVAASAEELFAADCNATRQLVVYDVDDEVMGDACTDRDFDQMCADDISGCYEKEENCLDDCGGRCSSCEAECATACVACGQGKAECTAARVACSDACLASREACHTKCDERGVGCYDRFDTEIRAACPDCMELSECMMDGCKETHPDLDDRCMAWCFAG